VVELYRQFQSGFNTGVLIQGQDATFGNNGIDHDINQVSTGGLTAPRRNAIFTFQLGRQVQRAKNADSVDQTQDPRTAKGPISQQIGSAADTWNGTQLATQLQFTNGQLAAGSQEQLLTYDGDTTGVFNVTQRGVQNNNSADNTCSGNSCHVQVNCLSASESESESGFCTNVIPDLELLRRQ
jgi:hypothetical protein